MNLADLGITGLTAVILTLFVTGFVEMVKAFYDKDYRTGLTILVAGIAGGVVAPFISLPIVTGICGGFAASGLLTLIGAVKK